MNAKESSYEEHVNYTLRQENARLRESNARLLEALKDAQCDLDAMKLLGQRLGSYETTRIKVRAAIAAAEGEK